MTKKLIFVLCVAGACLAVIAEDDIVVAQPASFTYEYFYTAYGEYTGKVKRLVDESKSQTGRQGSTAVKNSDAMASNSTSYAMGAASRMQMGGVASSFGPAAGYVSGEASAYAEGEAKSTHKNSSKEQNASKSSADQTN